MFFESFVTFDIFAAASRQNIHASCFMQSYDVLRNIQLVLFYYKIIISCVFVGLVIFSDARLLLIYGVSIILGVSKGSKAVFQSLIIPKYVSLEKLPAATGLSMVLNGFLSLIIGPIIGSISVLLAKELDTHFVLFPGLVHDLSSSYVYALHTASLLSLSCVLLWLIDALLKRRKLKHTATNIPI